jgi:hypothetical protein
MCIRINTNQGAVMGRNVHRHAVLTLAGLLSLAMAAQAQTPPVVREGARAGGRLSSDFGGGRLRGGTAVRSRFSDRIPGVTRGRDFDPVTAPPVALPAAPAAAVVDSVTGQAVAPVVPAPLEEVREAEVVVEETATVAPPLQPAAPVAVDRTRWNESPQGGHYSRLRQERAAYRRTYDFRDSRGVLVMTPAARSSARVAERPVLVLTPR